MQSSAMLRRGALVRTDVSQEPIASLSRVSRIGSVFRLLVAAEVVHTSQIFHPKIEVISSSETSVHTRATWRHITEDGNLHSHHRENLKSYIALTGWTQ
jgi:hypothetical protein